MKKRVLITLIMSVLCLLLSSCKSSDYKKAVKYQKEEKYEKALDIYNDLGNKYKDVKKRSEECQNLINAIKAFDAASKKVKEMNNQIDSEISMAETLVNNKDIALDESLRTTLETKISTTKEAKYDIPKRPKALDDIMKTTEQLNLINYDNVISELKLSCEALDKSIKQYALVNNPKDTYITECLSKVDNIIDISAVTEENDPNGNLNKAGGYTAQVYFSSDLVNQSSVIGNTVIDKGTNCGGSIEVYATTEDVVKRNDYLATYDGTIFASGSHIVIGTCLVRTSDKLTASQQKDLETRIIDQLTKIE